MKINELMRLFIDIDDVLAFSATPLQEQVNAKTVFKTNILKAIEQLRRNCVYYYDEIKKECQRAYEEKRLPDSSRFPLGLLNNGRYNESNFSFDKLTSEEITVIYANPIKSAMYYCNIAELIYEEFLEERDMFLERDNLPFGERKVNPKEKEDRERIRQFKELISNNQKALDMINDFCLREVTMISREAESRHEKPNYRNLVRMDSNDIIRTNEGVSKEDLVYKKPITDVKNCRDSDLFNYVLRNLGNYFDATSHEEIDYSEVYSLKNVNIMALEGFKNAIQVLGIKQVYLLTHHNGDREFAAKCHLMGEILPGVKVLGLRFHSEEHTMYRRGRSSKYENGAVKNGYGSENPVLDVLGDDSMDNYNDWEKHGASPFLIRPLTDAEKINGIGTGDKVRLIDYKYLVEVLSTIMNNIEVKVKNNKLLIKELK